MRRTTKAQSTARALGLSNIEFQVGDLRDLGGKPLGEFDYIVAHGLYAWVEERTREALLTVCAEHLAPHGLAYVSYNTHPGGHFRRMLRELALWHTRDAGGRAEAAAQARELFGQLSELRSDTDAWGALLAAELPQLAKTSTEFLIHDLLGDHWSPVWFSEFAGAAAEHGLQYVAEASFHRVSGPWEPSVEEGLRRLSGSDRVAYEQIVDVMVWRRFRDSILCRSGRSVADTIDRTLLPQLRFRTAGPLSGFGGETDPLLEALASLARPTVAFEQLGPPTGLAPAELANALYDAARRGRVTMHLDPPRLGTADVERPRISALARLQAVDQTYCTTLLGGVVQPQGPVVRALIQFADGSRDREQLRTRLVEVGGPALEPEQLETALQEFAALALVEDG